MVIDKYFSFKEKNAVGDNHFYVCDELIIGNMIQYRKDKEIYNFNKLCMVKIENANLLFAYLGEKNYLNHVKKAVLEIYEYLKPKKFDGILSTYIIDNSTFILVGKPQIKEDAFLKIIRKIYKNFHYIKPFQTNAPLLARFAVVIDQPNMVERALEELNTEINTQRHFIISEVNDKKRLQTKQELKMINTIYWAIQNNGVIPYYQGIYDNKKKRIEKYESLMRLKDCDGNIYSPDTFIDIAKKYHMYINLSQIMMRQVLSEIEDKDMEVSVNLSAYDINSSDFRKLLLELLEQRKSKKLLVFEILEDEIFKDPLILKQFIRDVEKYGVKIAIDDFGSGYSNLLEIAQISPQYLKIDGKIILKMNDSPNNRAVLESIVSLCKKTHTFTVAEHVENKEIQQAIEALAIDFSQGYYFAKPVPITDLKLY